MLATGIPSAAVAASSRSADAGASRAAVVPGEVIVSYVAGSEPQDRRLVRSRARLVASGKVAPRAELVRVGPDRDVDDVIAELEADPAVEYAEPNYIYEASVVTPNDPSFSRLWGLHQASDADIDAPEAWATTTGSAGVLVGITDTGIDYDHPDLQQNVWVNPGEAPGNNVDDDHNGYVDDVRGWDFVGNDGYAADPLGHGTHVAGTIGAAGNNGLGVSGVNWNVGIVPLRVLDNEGTGTSASIAAAFRYAGRMGLDLVNASLGGEGYSRSIADAIAAVPDTLFVVSAGNEGVDNDEVAAFPCNSSASNVICVAASTTTDTLASFSNYGIRTVDIAAPGVGILSTMPGGYGYASGTSMASPHVTGVAALARAAAPSTTAAELRTAILGGADPIPALAGRVGAAGRLNAHRTLSLVTSVVPAEQPSPSPTLSPSPSPTPSPSPSATEPGQTVEHPRTVTLRLSDRFRAYGSIDVLDGFRSCSIGVPLRIMRGTKTVARIGTMNNGSFSVKLPRRAGVYRAIAPGITAGTTDVCPEARSRRIFRL